MIAKIQQWLTPEQRQALQVVAASLIPFLVWAGLGSEEGLGHYLSLFGIALTFVANILNLVTLRVGDWGKGWAIVRGSIYTAATAAFPVFVALEFIDEARANYWLTGIILSLTVLSSFVSVFTSGHQAKQDIIEVVTELQAKG